MLTQSKNMKIHINYTTVKYWLVSDALNRGRSLQVYFSLSMHTIEKIRAAAYIKAPKKNKLKNLWSWKSQLNDN